MPTLKTTVVAWRGDDSQTWIPVFQTLATPNYQVNVEHAFATASTFADLVNSLPGRKYILAHSLGNMLVSAAAQDHGLEYSRYFLLNAAVPVEAYDESANAVNEATRARMTPPVWQNYPERVRAAGWHELFDASDPRSGLTWKGRFCSVSNTVNYYSTEDEVLKCGNGESYNAYQREWAWYNQERYKGVKTSLQNAFRFGRNEGGWAFNSAYEVTEQQIQPSVPGSPGGDQIVTVVRNANVTEAMLIAADCLKETPFFGPFADNSICTSNSIYGISTSLRAQLLADAIPAESLPAGFSEVGKWNCEQGRNHDLSTDLFKDPYMKQILPRNQWGHSFFIGVPYSVVHGFYENLKTRID